MGFISEETIQKVIAASDIVAVIQGYFPLKKAGPAWKALCPFHSERSPSFSVNPARQSFKCFGCGAGGGVVKFVEMHDHLSFPDAIRRLAERAGIPIIEEENDADALQAHRQRKELISLHREAMEWFHELLLTDPLAEPARRYWKSRGFDGQVARRWKIGFAPPRAATVLEWSRGRKIADALLVEGGFLKFDDDEGRRQREPWFRFAGRLMFPIANDQGEIVGFSGRILDSEAQAAKYLNSPETPIFNKGRLFFGLDRSRRAIAKQQRAIVCEGQLDLIACVEAGVENMVAPLGTAFTDHHARLLRRLADECVLCFDSDTAGLKAAGRAFRELSKAGMFVRVAELPPGEDPDSLIRSQGAPALLQRVEEAKAFVEFQLGALVRTTDMAQVRDRLRAAAELAGGIACLTEKAAQEDAINHAAVRLNVPADDMRRLVVRAVREAAKEASRERRPETDAPSGEAEAPVVITDKAILLLCRLLLTHGEARAWLREQTDTEFLTELAETELLRKLWALEDLDPADAAAVAAVLTGFTDAEQAFLSSLLSDAAPTRGAEDARVALLSLRSRWLKARVGLVAARIREAGLSDEEKLTLTQEYVAMSVQLRTVQGHIKLPASLIPF